MESSNEHRESRWDAAAGRVKKGNVVTDKNGNTVIRNTKYLDNHNTQGRLAKLAYGNG